VQDPSALQLPPRERAIAGLAALLTEAPWTVEAADLDRLRSAGVTDEGIVQTVTIAAAFNHLTRVADGTGIEPDYASPLPRIQIDASRQAVPRPARAHWPARPAGARLPLALRPGTQAAFAAWGAYVRAPSGALSERDRAVIGSAAAAGSCDEVGVASWGGVTPESAREVALARYATLLTEAPWRVGSTALEPLRALGLDDRGLLDVIGLVGTQNMESRVTLALG
jgi:alkylhydroperoxidase family enzyme